MELLDGMTDENCQQIENIRAEGSVNMYGAATDIQIECGGSKRLADKFLKFWMKNYDQLVDIEYNNNNIYLSGNTDSTEFFNSKNLPNHGNGDIFSLEILLKSSELERP